MLRVGHLQIASVLHRLRRLWLLLPVWVSSYAPGRFRKLDLSLILCRIIRRIGMTLGAQTFFSWESSVVAVATAPRTPRPWAAASRSSSSLGPHLLQAILLLLLLQAHAAHADVATQRRWFHLVSTSWIHLWGGFSSCSWISVSYSLALELVWRKETIFLALTQISVSSGVASVPF